MPERIITVRIQGANEVGPAFQAVRQELAALEAQAARTTITPGAALGMAGAAETAAIRTFTAETKSAAESYAVFAAAGLTARTSAKAVQEAVEEATPGVQRLSQAFGFGATEAQGFETVMARRLLPTIGLVSLNAGTIAAAGVLALGAGFALAARAGIELDATLEQETLRFQQFGMSAAQAQAHVQALFKLGAETPFTAEQLIQASRTLEVFGRGALDTETNLRLLGDTSAATGADLQALTFWVGRLYADLQAGKPIGEAEQNLRQLAVLTPQASKELERLAASGAPASQSFAAFTNSLHGFTGAMEAQSHTLQGLTSTLADNLGQLAGIAFAPAFDANKGALEGFNAALSDPSARHTAEDLASLMRVLGDSIAFTVDVWNSAPPEFKDWLLGRTVARAVLGAARETIRGPGAEEAGRMAFLDRGVNAGLDPNDPMALERRITALREQGNAMQQGGVFTLSNTIALERHSEAERADTRITQEQVAALEEAKRQSQGAADAVLDLTTAMSKHVDFGKQFESQVQNEAKVLDFIRDKAGPAQRAVTELIHPPDLENEFQRRRGGFPQDEVSRMAAQGQAQANILALRAAQNALATAAPGVRAQGDELAATQALIAAQDTLRISQTRSLLERAAGHATEARANDRETAQLQDALTNMERVDAAQQKINQAYLTKEGLLIRAAQEDAANNTAAAEGLRAEAGLWDILIGKYTTARDALKTVTDAQDAQRAKDQQYRFDQEQERARGLVSNQGVQEQITAFGRTQEQVQGQREIDRLTRQRDQDQARGNTIAVQRADREIEREQNHLKYLQEVGQNEADVRRLQLDLATANIDLAQAQHDGDAAAIEAVKEKIRLIKEFIAAVHEAGQAITETQPKTGITATGIAGFGNINFGGAGDPYQIYGPHGVVLPGNLGGTGPFGVDPRARPTRPSDLGKGGMHWGINGGSSGDFISHMTINGDVDRPTAQEIISAMMDIHRQATLGAIATSGSLTP